MNWMKGLRLIKVYTVSDRGTFLLTFNIINNNQYEIQLFESGISRKMCKNCFVQIQFRVSFSPDRLFDIHSCLVPLIPYIHSLMFTCPALPQLTQSKAFCTYGHNHDNKAKFGHALMWPFNVTQTKTNPTSNWQVILNDFACHEEEKKSFADPI